LVLKLKDAAWGTRVHSQLALSYLLKTYHTDFKEEELQVILDLMLTKLSENAASVRESAAIALVDLSPLLSSLHATLTDYISRNILRAKDQKPEAPLQEGGIRFPPSSTSEEAKVALDTQPGGSPRNAA
jgi:hypothetical protein